MRRRWGKRGKGEWFVLAAALLMGTVGGRATAKQEDSAEEGRSAYQSSDYTRAVQDFEAAAAKEPQNGEIQLLLTKCFLELGEHDAAIGSAEKAVEIDPKNSLYHEWLGKAYGEKASHASMFSALGLARKTRREFETAVELDEKNYSARQALIEFDCSAPSIVGGGEDKAHPEIAQLESMDASEWHYAKGNCRRQKKDFADADAEFQLALESHPKSAELIYDIGDYEVRRGHAGGLILENEKGEEAERLLREYLKKAPKRTGYPRYSAAHEWLGRLYEGESKNEMAENEYRAALQLDPKDKSARESLKRLRKD
jgi:tetratricopeptide (TPR) repeat protein